MVLRGRVLSRIDGSGVTRREIADRDELERTLRDVFGLAGVDVASLWERVEQQHAAYLERLAAGTSATTVAAADSP